MAYFVASGQKLDPMSERNMFLLPWCDINLIKADTMLAELESSNIYSSKNWVAGLSMSKIQTLVVQVLVSHRVMNGPVMSTIIDDVLNGMSFTTENWKVPPSPPGENILYLSSKVKALLRQELGHFLLKAVSLIFIRV